MTWYDNQPEKFVVIVRRKCMRQRGGGHNDADDNNDKKNNKLHRILRTKKGTGAVRTMGAGAELLFALKAHYCHELRTKGCS
jgi:hypothetical protein